MDTRWIKFKYSSFNKFICALLGCLLAGVCASSAVSAFQHIAVFGGADLTGGESLSYIDTREFFLKFNSDLRTIIDDASHNANQARYDAVKNSTVQRAEQFVADALPLIADYEEQYEMYEYYVNGYSAEVEEQPQIDYSALEERYGAFDCGYDDAGERLFFTMDTGDENISENVLFEVTAPLHKTADEIASQLNSQFGKQIYTYYCYETNDSGEAAKLELLNVRYYAEFSDGSTASNVEDPQAFVESVKSGADGYEYYISENARVQKSSRLTDAAPEGPAFYSGTLENLRLYVAVDSAFPASDSYCETARRVENAFSYDVSAQLYIAVFALFAAAVLFAVSLRLAGHTGAGEITAARTDAFPADIALLLAAAGLVPAALLGFALLEGKVIAVFGDIYSSSLAAPEMDFYLSVWYLYSTAACGAAAYLIALAYSSFLARNIKTGGVWRRTALYKLFVLSGRLFAAMRKAAGRLWKKLKNMRSAFSFLPQRLEKRVAWAGALFCAFNAAGFGFTALMFELLVHNGAEAFCLPLLAVIAAADIFCIYKAIGFMRALDALIECSAKNEPVGIDLAGLPQSLKTLAASLDKKNAQLQQAVIKAVKDERTKTELITNVSHDLKTPLTSVINYIDLLKKCDIKDDEARRYMDIIDEKSQRLKRLIEDLIEASKVAAGSVTVNKTMINLNELAAQAVVEFAQGFENRSLELVFDEPRESHIVFADGTKIYRVLENLLSNAQKYSAPGSRVYIRLYSSGGFGCFEIKNISKDALNISAEELMERFVRGDRSRSEEGNGLGLSIAKELCALNGGRLDIQIDGDLFKAAVLLPATREDGAK